MTGKAAANIIIDHRKAFGGGLRRSPGHKILLRDIGRPQGLISDWEDPVWEFQTVRVTGTNTMPWSRRFHDGSRLTDPQHADFLETARRFLTVLINDPMDSLDVNRNTAFQRTYTLLAIIDWALWRGHSSLRDISPSEWELFQERIPYGAKTLFAGTVPKGTKVIAAGTVLEYFRIFQHLYDFGANDDAHGALLADGLDFPPFEFPGDAIKIARATGAETGRTKTIPSPIALSFLEAAIQYVADYSDDILELNRQVEKAVAKDNGPKRRRPGEAYADLAALLLRGLGSPAAVPMRGENIKRSAVARQLGLFPSQLSGEPFVSVLSHYERWIRQDDSDEKTSTLVRLRAKLNEAVESQRSALVPKTVPRNLAQQIGLPFSGKAGSASPWPLTAVGSSRFADGNTLEAATVDLWSAIFVIIGSFMADRLAEALETEVDCVTRGLDGPYFESRFFKDTNADVGLSDCRPCPEIVAKAVEVAEQLGRSARGRTNSTKLFMASHRLGDSVPDETTMRKRLADFGSRINVPRDQSGEIWQIAPHQLRRFFAQAWVWYYELGPGLDALRQHLRQTDLQNAIRYAASKVQGEILGEEQKELTASILERSLFEGLDLEGPFGRRWLKLAARLRVSMADPDELVQAVRRHIDHKSLCLHPMPWGYCAWSKEAAKAARCMMGRARQSGEPRPESRKSAEVCGGGCANFLTHDAFRPFWAGAVERHGAVAQRKGVPSELKAAALQGERIARRHLAEEIAGERS